MFTYWSRLLITYANRLDPDQAGGRAFRKEGHEIRTLSVEKLSEPALKCMSVNCLVTSDCLNFGHGRRPCNKVHKYLTRNGLVSREKVPDVKSPIKIIGLPLHHCWPACSVARCTV